MSETKSKRPDGFDLAAQWFEQWGPRLSEYPWTADVPHEGQHQLGAMIERALGEAYRAGADREEDRHRRIAGATARLNTSDTRGSTGARRGR